jgi:hypothetical protein
MNTDFEKWFISQLTKEGDKYYFMVGAYKVYVYFEGQTADVTDAFVNMRIVPYDTSIIATGAKYHSGQYTFFIYGINALLPDKITDTLATMLDEKIIEETGGFRIQMGIISTHQRGNKFKGSSHYENIVNIDFQHWEHQSRNK